MRRRNLLQLLASSIVLLPSASAGAAGLAAGSLTSITGSSTAGKKGYITFVINVHEWAHIDQGYVILNDLCSLFSSKGVKGDFYVTAPMAEKLASSYPATVSAMKLHGISYHSRPPHPLYTGFDASLQGLSATALTQTITDFETYGQNLTTGALDKTKSGGFTKVKEVFGRAPCAVSIVNSGTSILTSAAAVYKSMGAKMIVAFHEGESDPANPFVQKYNLLVRPSHLKLTHSTGDEFWWNTVSAGKGGDPTESLKTQLSAWKETKLPFATAIIHENNFFRSGPEAWTSVYYMDEQKTTPLAPSFNLSAAEWGKERSSDSKSAIWQAYRDLVYYCADNMNVVTSQDIVTLSTTG